jgi:hypothetical protein
VPTLIGFKPSKGDGDILCQLDKVAQAGTTISDYLRQLIRSDIRGGGNGRRIDAPVEPSPPHQASVVSVDAHVILRLCTALEALEKKIAPYPGMPMPFLNEAAEEPAIDEDLEKATDNFMSMFG